MRLFHETSPENARSILAQGFRDGGGIPSGVFVADAPPRFRDAWVRIAVDVDLTSADLDRYAYNRHQWPPHGNAYREWCVPAAVLNRYPRVLTG